MDEAYIKVKGKWTYYYRAVDKFGRTFDFMPSEHRDEAAATAFFTRAIGNNGFPDQLTSTASLHDCARPKGDKYLASD